MSDESNAPIIRDPDTFDLKGKEFAAFLEDKCQAMTCPACGNEEPPILDADSAEGPVHLSVSPIINPSNYGNKGYCTAHCQNCGFNWQFDASKIADWAIEMRKEATHNE